jgi:chondroitin AC lyase
MKTIVFVIILFGSVPCFAQIDTVLARYKRVLMQRTIPEKTASVWLQTINTNGQWPDVDYKDTVKANWKTSLHLQHTRDLAILFNSSTSSFYHSAAVATAINASLDHWLQQRYKNSNWWHNQIGVPQLMRDIIILFRDSLTPERFKQSMEVLAQHRVNGTGANLTWSADLAFHYGALSNDTALMHRCVDLLRNEIKISDEEGVRYDYSFHQHGHRLQIYSYGAAFLKENVRLAWELRGTPWAYPAEKTAILVNFVLEGWQWMARGIHTVPGTIDRSVSRSNALHNADIRDILPMLNELDPSKAETFSAINNQQNDKGSWLQGFRYFPMSDFTAYHQPGFSFFLKTISARTLPAESINSENLKGHLMNSGDAYIIQNGQEYYNLMPVWNWDYLPGITNVAGGEKIFRLPGVGGVTDGKSGVTIMDYVMVNKAGAQILSAKKFWACNRNMVVCLIAGLQSDSTAFTVLDQSRKLSEVITHKTGAATSWIHHNKTAYIFLQPSVVDLQVRQVTGNWRSFNLSQSATPVTETVFYACMETCFPTGRRLYYRARRSSKASEAADQQACLENAQQYRYLPGGAIQRWQYHDSILESRDY